MIIPAQTLRRLRPVEPFHERSVFRGMSFGLGPAGYDVRVADSIHLIGGGSVELASTIEKFTMPPDVLGVVHDKSSWARQGVFVQNTIIEPGWTGFLTLELTYHANLHGRLYIEAGSPIAQIIFHRLEAPTELPYTGKYQNQQAGPQPAIFEGGK